MYFKVNDGGHQITIDSKIYRNSNSKFNNIKKHRFY